ncbi:MAG: hypothetical protein EOO27_21445 [Comamonadaceae bacterium]|nr:MAG: hypothetical protein EOO27_21445 [Comamonadaceae bacterium]
MLDISQATNMLTSLGVSSTMAAKAAERTAQKHAGADPVTFLKELQATLEELTANSPLAGASASTAPEAAASAPYKPTADRYGAAAAGTPTVSTASAASAESVKAPFNNLEEFKQWEKGLGSTFADDYETPDYIRLTKTALSGGDDTVVSRYMFFKNNPEFAADYESIRSGQLSKFPTDGSTLVKSDLSKMSDETAAYYKKNPQLLLAAEGFNMDPTLAKMRMSGEIAPPAGADASEWLMSNTWTKDGIVAQNNRVAYANADYLGLDGKGADTYRLTRFEPATGNYVNYDGKIYDPLTGEAKA